MIKILSYNIHKGFAAGNRTLISEPMKPAIHALDPDLVFLQEVVGQNELHRDRFAAWPAEPQHDFFRSEDLAHAAYGKNVVYAEGHHGNAILSRTPILSERNIDISVFKFEPRGILHAVINSADSENPRPLHALCVHLGLIEYERRSQAAMIAEYVEQSIAADEPLLLVGDFNDWRERLSKNFAASLLLKEAFLEQYGSHARSFPSWFPVSRLDRIYYRNLVLKGCERLVGKPWSRLSDHIPLVAEFERP